MFCAWCHSNRHNENTCPKLARLRGNSVRYCTYCRRSKNHSSDNCPIRPDGVRARELEQKRKKGEFDGIDLRD